MDKGFADKHRYTYSKGVKAVEESKWGASKARERYGQLDYDNASLPPPKDATAPQKLGDPTNLRAPDYDPNHGEDWVRGFGKGGIESAEGKPGFDHGGKRR